MRSDPRDLLLFAWLVSIVATLGSLRYSGIGFLGLDGLGLPPCELCWYQRILMYPLTGVLGVAYVRRDARVASVGLGLSAVGGVLALYHSLIQYLPRLEAGECIVGSCTSVMYKVLGLSIPNQSLLAFLLIILLVVAFIRGPGPAGQPKDATDAAVLAENHR